MSAVITTITGLQNLPNLESFNADWNGLTTVDLSGMTNLTTVDISDCDIPSGENAGNPSLTSVNVTGCTSITELRLDDSNFSENGISSIIGLSSLTNLNTIDIDECGLSGSIDLSMISSLADVDLGNNYNLTEVIISSSQPISDFGANDCAFSQEVVDSIITTLSENGVSSGYVNMQGEIMGRISAETLPAVRTLANNGWSLQLENYSSQFPTTDRYDTEGEACADTNFGNSVYTLTDTDVEIGNTIYTDSLLVTPRIDGWFKLDEDNNIYLVSGSGLIVSQSTCV